MPNGRGEVPNEYITALCEEIRSYKGRVGDCVDTVYFGGGTPSLLSPLQLEKVMTAARESFLIKPDAEITFEANPGTLTKEKALTFRRCGFNRVSLGLQSIHENEMKKLGRIHTYQEFLDTFSMLREVGFDNISVDLMYGIPHQTKESFRKTVEAIVALSPEHISAYGLIVEEGTPFFCDDDLVLPELDEECDMYELAAALLRDAGYEHYEISNYARVGYRSRHNTLYWRFGEYIGVGAAAHSFLASRRFYNTDSVAEYIFGIGRAIDDNDELDLAYEYAMLGLRLKDGFSLDEYERLFGRSFTEGKEEIISRLEREGLLTISGERIALTERGFYLSNSILVEIL